MGEYVHSQQVQFSKSPVSCGIMEVHHLPADTTGNQMVFAIANQLYHKANGRPAAFVMWSDVTGKQEISRGELLAGEVSVMGIGSLFISERAVNPKTGNTIMVYFWTLDHDMFRDWYTKEYANRLEI